jgi:ferredoxin-type protein NapH
MKLDKKLLLKTILPGIFAGFSIFLIQLFLFRHTLTFVDSNEISIGFFFSIWLMGLGLGGWFLKKGDVSYKFALLGVMGIFSIWFLSSGRVMFGVQSTDIISNITKIKIIFLGVFPVSLLCGSIIPSIGGKNQKILISLEASGSLIAGLLYSFGGLVFVESHYLLIIFVLPLVFFSSILTWKKSWKFLLIWLVPLMVIAGVVTPILCGNPQIKGMNTKSFYGANGHIQIFKDKTGRFNFIENGELSFVFPDLQKESSLELLVKLNEKGGDINIVGDFPLAYHLSFRTKNKIYLIVTNKKPYEYILNKGKYKKRKNLVIIEGDPVKNIKSNTGMIVLPSVFPKDLKSHRILTDSYLKNLKARLKTGGVLICNVNLPGLYPPKPFIKTLSIFKSTFDSVFSKSYLLVEDTIWVYGGKNVELPSKKEEFRSNEKSILYGVIQNPEIVSDQISYFKNKEITTLNDPVLLIYSLRSHPGGGVSRWLIWIRKGEGKSFFVVKGNLILYLIIILILFGLLFYRKIKKPENSHEIPQYGWLIALTGFAAMITQINLLLNLQSGDGYIIRDVGVVSGIFMFSFALGSFKKFIKIGEKIFIPVLSLKLALLMFVLPYILNWNSNLSVICGLSLVSGFLTGSLIPVAFKVLKEYKKTLSLVFFNDHIGGSLGALFGGVLLLPSIGAFGLFRVLSFAFIGTSILFVLPLFIKGRNLPARAKTFPWSGFSIIFMLVIMSSILFLSYKNIERGYGNETLKPVKGVVFKAKPFPHTEITNGKKMVVEIDTFQLKKTKTIKGYAAPIQLKIRFDKKGKILDIILGKNKETPSFVKLFKPWLKKFIGLDSKVDLYGKNGVDTISGATLSTKAIKSSIDISRRTLLTELLKQKVKVSKKPKKKVNYFPVFIVSLFILGAVIISIWGNAWIRFVFLTGSLFVFGYWLNLMFSLMDLGLLYLSIAPTTILKWLVIGVIGLMTLTLGNIWCGFLCPLGALQEVIYTIPRILISLVKGNGIGVETIKSKGEEKLNKEIAVFASYFKYVLLGISMLFFVFSANMVFLAWDPLTYAFGKIPNSVYYSIFVIILLGSVYFYRPHCRFFCPAGAFLSFSNLLSPLKKFLPLRKIRDCDYGVKSLSDITCVRCNRCSIKRKPRAKPLAKNKKE